jgi:hypothetical protein
MQEPNTAVTAPASPEARYPGLKRDAGPGRPKGTLNRINKLVKERMAEAIASGDSKHPAQILLDIANDAEMPPGIRRSAAADLLPYLMPIKFNVEVETSEVDAVVEFERIRTTLSTLTGASHA